MPGSLLILRDGDTDFNLIEICAELNYLLNDSVKPNGKMVLKFLGQEYSVEFPDFPMMDLN